MRNLTFVFLCIKKALFDRKIELLLCFLLNEVVV